MRHTSYFPAQCCLKSAFIVVKVSLLLHDVAVATPSAVILSHSKNFDNKKTRRDIHFDGLPRAIFKSVKVVFHIAQK